MENLMFACCASHGPLSSAAEELHLSASSHAVTLQHQCYIEMKPSSRLFLDTSRSLNLLKAVRRRQWPSYSLCASCQAAQQRRLVHSPADSEDFVSVVDNPPRLV